MSEKNCGTCRFSRVHTASPSGFRCHRRAPKPSNYSDLWWPWVPEDEWCGEWEAKEVEEPPAKRFTCPWCGGRDHWWMSTQGCSVDKRLIYCSNATCSFIGPYSDYVK